MTCDIIQVYETGGQCEQYTGICYETGGQHDCVTVYRDMLQDGWIACVTVYRYTL